MKQLMTYEDLIRENATVFHQTISKGAFDKNRLLASETIEGNLNNFDVKDQEARETTAQFHKNFNAGEVKKNAELFAPTFQVNGQVTFFAGVTQLQAFLPDVQIKDHHSLEGHRAAVQYTTYGTHKGDFNELDGSVIKASGKQIAVKGLEFMTFNTEGLLEELIIISNQDDLLVQLSN